MNRTSRHLFLVVLVMFLALMASAGYTQFFKAGELNADGRNTRTIYREYGRDRGPIVVAGTPIATSTPVDDVYEYQRSYPDGPTYAHVTGYFSTAFNSLTGIERAENQVLNGTSTSFFLQRVQALFTGEQPQGGVVELTLDPEVQAAARAGLDGRRGAVVALEPATGRVLAHYSSPSYDPNGLATHVRADANAYLEQVQADEDRPMIDRAIAGDQEPPGSVFKVVTAAAMIEAEGLTPDSQVLGSTSLQLPQSNNLIHNDGGADCGGPGETTSLRTAFAESCNTTFAQGAIDRGAEGMQAMSEAFGFNADLTTPLPVSASRYPTPGSAAETAMTGIGQASVRATPMQMAMVAAAVANEGRLMRPYVVDRELSADLDVVTETTPSEMSRPVDADTAATLTDLMESVVTDGSGRRAAVPGVRVAGKTGTAEIAQGTAPTVWFIGFAPAEDPRIAVAVMLEDGGGAAGGTGGTVAAPIAQRVLAAGVAP